jgi:hypothetical protein
MGLPERGSQGKDKGRAREAAEQDSFPFHLIRIR